MDCPFAKFGDYTFSRFGFIVQTDRITDGHCLTHATIVGSSNYVEYA